MPRKARIHAPGTVHHVMARGIDGTSLFNDDADRARFLDLLARRLVESGCRCYAWALMENHYHLVLRTGEFPLWVLMKPLNTDYARYFNKKYGRRGYLFQDRFRSIATQDQLYLERLVQYVHLNPVRAGSCRTIEELDSYPWTGHAALMGTIPRPFQDTRAVLRRFGQDPVDARQRYGVFMREGMAACGESEDLVTLVRQSNFSLSDRHATECWVIGDTDFVKAALQNDAKHRTAVARYLREGWDMERMAQHVSSKTGVPCEQIRLWSKRTAQSTARMLLCHLAREAGFPAREIGEYLNIMPAAVSASARRGREIAKSMGIGLDNN